MILWQSGAEHTVRFYPAELSVEDPVSRGKSRAVHRNGNDVSLFHVDGVGHDLQNAVFSRVYRTDAQSLRIRMTFDFYNFTSDYFIDFIPVGNDLLDLETAIEQFFFKLFGRAVHVHEIFDPTERC